jgi:hypothetical protein
LYYYSEGVANYKFTNDAITLGPGSNNILGRAVLVHADEDQCTVPSAGGRLAWCVIGTGSPYTTVVVDANTPTSQNFTTCNTVYPETTTGVSSASQVSTTIGLLLAGLLYFLIR